METFDILATLIKVVVVFAAVLVTVMVMTLAERRVAGFIQYRLGPNRVGPWGLLQPVADGLKFLFKEDIIPDNVNRPIYLLAPVITMIPAFMTFAVIPFGADLDLRTYGKAASGRYQHRTAVYPGPNIGGGVWAGAGGVELREQVPPVGRPALLGPADQL